MARMNIIKKNRRKVNLLLENLFTIKIAKKTKLVASGTHKNQSFIWPAQQDYKTPQNQLFG